MALVAAPFAAQAETWNIYGWQNHSWEFVDIDGGRSFDRIQSNAGNIGFAASVDTGMNGIKVNLQCEQFTYYNHFSGGTGWCNRNSKIGLSHPQMGEIMFATWLLPYNEGVAQWVDPFYDAGADSHTNIMGSVGANTIFYNTGDFDFQASNSGPGTGFDGNEFNYAGGGYDTGFNRRQENIIQYWSPNWNGFVFRFAWTAGFRDETTLKGVGTEVDPVIRSSSLAYTNGPFWGAVTWQDHEDWTAASIGTADSAVMRSSDAESIRVAGRYIMDLGDGMSVQLSAMWEDLEYEFNGVTNVDAAMAAFGYTNFGSSYDLLDSAGEAIGAKVASEDDIKAQKTLGLIRTLFPGCWGTPDTGTGNADAVAGNDSACPASFASLLPGYTVATTGTEDNPVTDADETDATDATPDNSGASVLEAEGDNPSTTATAIKAAVEALKAAAEAELAPDADDDATTAYENAVHQYGLLLDAATDAANEEVGLTAAANREAMTAGQNVTIERDAWMVSGKIKFGGPVDFRFSYMDADDLEVSCASCSGDWDETAAQAWNVGVFYTMPAGTELRLTYSEVDNDDNGTYGQGISGTGLGTAGTEIEMFAVGIVHWFD